MRYQYSGCLTLQTLREAAVALCDPVVRHGHVSVSGDLCWGEMT
jgi:hypothetical protein